jgi:dynein heavy chain 1
LHERFGSTLGDQIRAITAEYVDAKTKLEGVQLDGAPRDVISSVIYVQEMCEKEPKLGARLASLEAGEKVLRRQRYAFQANFPQISLALSAASDFRTILGRRSSVMEDRIPTLQTQVSAESKAAAGRISTLLAEWSEQRPLSGDTPHAEALDTLARFAASVQRSRAELSRLVSALAALGLESSTETSEVTLAATEREVSELKEVWSALAGAHERMAELGETPWGGVTPRKLRRELEALVQDLRGLANRVRQYDAYTYAQDLLKRRLEVVPRLVELRSESLKERHWRVILARLSVATPLVQLSLGHMWDKHLGDLGDIMSQAQGEMALEEFLREVRDFWAGSELDLIGYQGRVRLVRGWSVVFAKLEEHLGSIGSMKSSPYFTSVPEFQEEGALWEDRLTRLQSIFDAWVDVQRRWVYLEGVFFGSADIKAQLPQEFSRFKAVDGEFVALMRRVAAKPTVLDLLSGPHDGLLRQLERQGSLMSKIQKALGDYLEKQRAAFSRFYFVGDEDLLEIIGNANEPAKMMQHLSKMFAGIAGVEISELTLSTMMSKDGEVVPFKHPIKLDSKGVRDWLAELEAEMKSTLSALLQMSMRGAEPVESDPAGDLFEGFPAQV